MVTVPVAPPPFSTATIRFLQRGAAALLALTAIGCTSGAGTDTAGRPANEEDMIAGMQIVDCLLPGQLRSLGSGTYLTARRPVKTTASDCNIRGGEYVAYDRANYKTALKVWMPAAEAGDAEAQVNVGEIFEKGLGTEPNYEAAAIWYERAAEQGNKRGLFNLGTLYEQGLGVERDKLKALNLYRQAWGLPEDSVMYQETARQQQEELRKELTAELEAKESQVRLLEKQIQSLKAKLEKASGSSGAEAAKAQNQQLAAELETLQQLVDQLRGSRNNVEQKLASLPQLRAPSQRQEPTSRTSSSPAEATTVEDMNFGEYYALIIGNRDYAVLDDLATPWNDARELGNLLENKYGFHVNVLLDADRFTIMKAINDLHDRLDENDNLLLYYAGHGNLVNVGERDTGYWLPTNADPPPDDSFWVPNEFVTNHLGRINAKRVLVIADSCYGGLMSSSPGHLFLQSTSADKGGNYEYIRYKLPRRSRLLMSSGGDKPVIDNGGDGHSVFARELIETLRNNSAIMTAPELFAAIKEPVQKRAVANNFTQEPIYKSIKGAGHEIGDFFFVPRTMAQ